MVVIRPKLGICWSYVEIYMYMTNILIVVVGHPLPQNSRRSSDKKWQKSSHHVEVKMLHLEASHLYSARIHAACPQEHTCHPGIDCRLPVHLESAILHPLWPFLNTCAINSPVANLKTGFKTTINHNQTVKNVTINSPLGVAPGSKAGGWELNKPHTAPWQLFLIFGRKHCSRQP